MNLKVSAVYSFENRFYRIVDSWMKSTFNRVYFATRITSVECQIILNNFYLNRIIILYLIITK